MKQSFTIRLEPEQIKAIQAIAPEGNVSMWIRSIINQKLKGEMKMKLAILETNNAGEFILIDKLGKLISDDIDAGTNDEEPDWDLVEAQANELGYSIHADENK